MSNSQQDTLHDIHNYCVNTKTREIFLHNHYGLSEENPGVEYRMSNTFIKNVRTLDNDNNKPILIHMHSIGGEWSDGMAIYDSIQMSRSNICIVAYGQVESMSSIILQAADQRIITPNTYFMSHNGSTSVAGSYNDVQNWVKYEKHLNQIMIEIYASRCIKGKFFKENYNKPTLQLVKNYLSKQLLNGDWYINAEEAVYYGFADGVLGSRKYPSIQSVMNE